MSDKIELIIRADERKKCVDEIRKFASEYVCKWIEIYGDNISIKAEGWAILQASEALRK